MPTQIEDMSEDDKKQYDNWIESQLAELRSICEENDKSILVHLELIHGFAFVADRLQDATSFYKVMIVGADNVLTPYDIKPSWYINTGPFNPNLPVVAQILDQFNPDMYDGYILNIMGYDINGMMYSCSIPVNREKWELVMANPEITWQDLLKKQHDSVMKNVIVASSADMAKIAKIPMKGELR